MSAHCQLGRNPGSLTSHSVLGFYESCSSLAKAQLKFGRGVGESGNRVLGGEEREKEDSNLTSF